MKLWRDTEEGRIKEDIKAGGEEVKGSADGARAIVVSPWRFSPRTGTSCSVPWWSQTLKGASAYTANRPHSALIMPSAWHQVSSEPLAVVLSLEASSLEVDFTGAVVILCNDALSALAALRKGSSFPRSCCTMQYCR